ncbi:MAG: phenylacetate--CoA ligase [Desulfomicrobium sp.]|nr:phenylacetate--CoA ligase [Pseudomonadota bacterium]MBV1713673.1 phenylacetate--CoA ligase [Desulfomicrobium sp.]MBU4572209.1 phenylacetate--CoA ligase [Pseudomonadota bacterium]MBU4594187.1 phenylacetate--CoA ligase [Pseudomonadota bacterium]MBV1720862.1 phenylacetate--CoA ligase [Desulfomicrobium sp.]
MYWQSEYECMERGELELLQLERLQATLNRVARNVPLYRKRFAELGIDPYDVQSLEDVKRLPFTTKEDLRQNYPYGLFAVPLRDVVRMQASTGTTGKPTVVGYTSGDVRRWSELAARILTAGGVTKDDAVQIAFNYGLFTGAFGVHSGAELIGASVIPSSGGDPRRQISIMQDYRTTALICTPSYALHLADTLDELNINKTALSLRFGLFGSEPWTEETRREIEDRLGIQATDNYGLSEITGVAGECLERVGLHINEDHFLAEIVDPQTGEVLPAGVKGELVLTTLTKEAFPLIRFRTGDLTTLIDAPCACGRTLKRMTRIPGRSDDMLIIHGVNVFPAQIEAVISGTGLTDPHYQIVLDRVGHMDLATIMLEAPESFCTDSIKQSQRILENVRIRLQTELGVAFEVRLVEPRTIAREDGGRVNDRRKM